MDFEIKNRENREKNYSPNYVFFDCIFPLTLGGFGEDFQRVLGGVWRVSAPLGSLFDVIFGGSYSELSPKWLLEASGFHFGGFGEGLGEFIIIIWESLYGQKLYFRWIMFFDFVLWLLMLSERFGTKTGCLKMSYVS